MACRNVEDMVSQPAATPTAACQGSTTSLMSLPPLDRSSLPPIRMVRDCGTVGRTSSGAFGLPIVGAAPPARDRTAPGGSPPRSTRFIKMVTSSRCIISSRCCLPMQSMPVPTARGMDMMHRRTSDRDISSGDTLSGMSNRAGTPAG